MRGTGGRPSRYQRQAGSGNNTTYRNPDQDDDAAAAKLEAAQQRRRIQQAIGQKLDERFRVASLEQGESKRGWLYNMLPTTVSCIVPALWFCRSSRRFSHSVLRSPKPTPHPKSARDSNSSFARETTMTPAFEPQFSIARTCTSSLPRTTRSLWNCCSPPSLASFPNRFLICPWSFEPILIKPTT